MKLVIVVPAFNESRVIHQVIKSIPNKFTGVSDVKIAVIDDGSTDSTYNEASKHKVTILKHVLNRGAGAATKTGLDFAKKTDADIAVTFDADGQHDPQDIQKLILPVINKKADVVIGSRLKKKQPMPFSRKTINILANLATFVLFGIYSTDSQSGLRAFSKKALRLIDIKSDRMEFSSEIIFEAKHNNLIIKEVPIKAIYTQYSKEKGQKLTNAIPVFVKIVVKLLR